MKNIIIVVLFTTALLVVAVGSYTLGKQQSAITQLVSILPTPLSISNVSNDINRVVATASTVPTIIQPLELASPSASPYSTRESVRSIIISSLDNKHYVDLEQYMTKAVTLRFENSDCCGEISAYEATVGLEYLNNAIGPWDFTNTNPVGSRLATAFPQYYGNEAIVGTTANGYAAAFWLNGNNEIEVISITNDYSVLVPITTPSL